MKTQAKVTFAIAPHTGGFRMATEHDMAKEMIDLYGDKETEFERQGDRLNVLCNGCHVAYIETVPAE